MAPRTSLLLLGALLLGVQAALAVDITKEYGVCPMYTTVAGDGLYSISQKLNISQADLTASIQDCGGSIENLQVGQHLCLPGYDLDACANVLETDPDRPWCQVYSVQKGDTVKSVADKFGIGEQELIDLNTDYLDDGYTLPVAGQYVRLPGWDQVQCRDFNDNDRAKCQMYTVVQGDTPMAIANKFKVDLEDMLALNNLTASDVVSVNMQIKLPEWDASCPAGGIPAVVPSDTVDCRVTRLQIGESLALLAERYGTTVTAIQAANPSLTNAITLQPGVYVNIPAFDVSCVGRGNLVDVPGQSEVPADYDYNGVGAPSSSPSPSPAASPSTVPSPSTAPSTSPSPSIAAPSQAPSSVPAASAPVPEPTAAPAASALPPAGGALAATGSSVLAAALVLLSAVVLL